MMTQRFYPVLETPLPGAAEPARQGAALARIVDRHPDLARLFDFYYADPYQVAREVGMASADDPEDEGDLDAIDFGPPEWYEAAAGLAAVQASLAALRQHPETVREALYDPGLRPEDVIADLESIERLLAYAAQHEVRFHFLMDTAPSR